MSSKLFKIITGGDEGVGKTTLLYRYVKDRFIADTKSTIGVNFFWKKLNMKDIIIDLQLWDFAGQQDFRHILKNYATGANGALLLFDLTNKSSLEQIDDWVDIFRESTPDLPIMFLGTKLDLADLVIVEDKEAIIFKEKYGFLDYIKVSSKTAENVNLAFQLLVNEIIKAL
ncbi:MAG: GTP-binding protein [Promethearchaeota archaeon]|jgi:small GTP-binding protein